MRTTLTLDDDLALRLKRRAAELNRPFKEVVNQAIRRGMEPTSRKARKPVVKTVPFPSGLRPGIDPEKLNQLADQLEVDAFATKHGVESAAS